METASTTMRAWAIPLGFQVFGQEVGDHTWVTSDDKYCEGCRFGVVPPPDDFYCGPARWSGTTYTPPPSPPSRLLGSGPGRSNVSRCVGGEPYRFMGIPSQSGIVYVMNGVCHSLSNRLLYNTNVTVAGAAGYWFIQSLYGTYGTTVPMAMFPPLIWVPFPPFLIANPLHLVALAVNLHIAVDWHNLRIRCAAAPDVSEPEDAAQGAYLQGIRAIHDKPVEGAGDEWTADAVFAALTQTYERHMAEIDLTLEYRGAGIDASKLDYLRALWAEFHAPSRERVDALFGDRNVMRLDTPPDVVLSEHDTEYLAQSMNQRAAETLRAVVDILGPEDFEKYHGHSVDTPFLVVEPDILRGAATTA